MTVCKKQLLFDVLCAVMFTFVVALAIVWCAIMVTAMTLWLASLITY